MNRRLYVRVLLFSQILSLSVGAGAATTIKINSASVDTSAQTIVLEGANFPTDGTLEISIGDTFLEYCDAYTTTACCDVSSATTAACSFENTPAVAGGTWNVSVSAGNSPHNYAAIDVYIPTGEAPACDLGDFRSCYPGEQSEIDVGTCKAGVRTCQGDGTFTSCTGAITPLTEYPDHCDDGLDNDCDGRIDNGCDVLTENPTIFSFSRTFSLPPNAATVNIAVWGPGASGLGVSGGGAGSGGGSGGLSVNENLAVEEGDQFEVTMTGSRSAVSMNGVEIISAMAGSDSYGGDGSTLSGNDGGAPTGCTLDSGPGTSSCISYGGEGGAPLDYLGYSAGAGGDGQTANIYRSCSLVCTSRDWLGNCTYTLQCNPIQYSTVAPAQPGEPGKVIVSWEVPTP